MAMTTARQRLDGAIGGLNGDSLASARAGIPVRTGNIYFKICARYNPNMKDVCICHR